jgi:hypothetical protein
MSKFRGGSIGGEYMGMLMSPQIKIVGYQAILYILPDQKSLFNAGIADCAYDFLYQNKYY